VGYDSVPPNEFWGTYGLVAADLNNDGRTDFVFILNSTSGPPGPLTVFQLDSTLNSGVSTAVTAQGVSVTGTSSQSIQASYGGDNLYSPSLSNSLSLAPVPISPAPITWSAPAAITYGTPLSATQLNAASTVPGTFAYSPASGTILGAGTQTLTVTFTPTDTSAYEVATSSVQLTVKQAGSSTTLALSNQNLTLTATVAPQTTGTPTGKVTFLSGQTNIGTATLAKGAASYTLTTAPAGSATITAEYSGDSNFAQSSSAPVPVLAISAASTTLTVGQAGSVSDMLTLTTITGLSGTLQTACSGLPANSICTFRPASVSFSGASTPATVQVTI
jgi:hypothetical protein